jgi:hypothetical protein
LLLRLMRNDKRVTVLALLVRRRNKINQFLQKNKCAPLETNNKKKCSDNSKR